MIVYKKKKGVLLIMFQCCLWMNSKKISLNDVFEFVLIGDDSELESFKEWRFRRWRFWSHVNCQGDNEPPIKYKEIPQNPLRKAIMFGRKRVFKI